MYGKNAQHNPIIFKEIMNITYKMWNLFFEFFVTVNINIPNLDSQKHLNAANSAKMRTKMCGFLIPKDFLFAFVIWASGSSKD